MTGQALANVNGTTAGVSAGYVTTPANVDFPLRRLRRRRGMTLAILSARAGLSVSFLSMVENGHRQLSRRDHVNALAFALEVTPSEVAPSTLSGSDEWTPSASPAAAMFPAIRDDITVARHKDFAEEFTSYVIRGDGCAAGTWLRRIARDPSVSPWLLLDQLAAPANVQRAAGPAPFWAGIGRKSGNSARWVPGGQSAGNHASGGEGRP